MFLNELYYNFNLLTLKGYNLLMSEFKHGEIYLILLKYFFHFFFKYFEFITVLKEPFF